MGASPPIRDMYIQQALSKAVELDGKGDLKGSRKVYLDLVARYPDDVHGWLGLGAVEDELSRKGSGRFGGKEAFVEALKLRHIPTVINDLGNIMLRNELRWREAEMFYREAVIRHGLKEAAQNLAVCLLNTATVKGTSDGWREAWQWYEWRDMNTLRDHPMVWRGEPLAGKRLMVQFEQGFGDHVWALRFLKQAKEEGATVIAVVQPNSIRLCIAQPYIDEVYNIQEDNAVDCDYVTMLLSMPGYMLPGSLPKTEGRYIETGIDKPQRATLRVGLAWSGSVDKGYQSWRNIPLERLKPVLAARPDIEFVSLQKGKSASAAKRYPIETASIYSCADVWDTACLMEGLDLVISTDTMIPHLSAALGIETWLLDRWSSCWQFGIGGPESDPHWYEHLSVYRQPSFGDWAPVVANIVEKIKTWQPC